MILNSSENGKHTLMILINLQMAFDNLDHKILPDKIKCMSCSDKATKWFHAYLTNRTFFVSLNSAFSEAGTIKLQNSAKI